MKKQDFDKMDEDDRMFMLLLEKWMVHFAYWTLIGFLAYILRS